MYLQKYKAVAVHGVSWCLRRYQIKASIRRRQLTKVVVLQQVEVAHLLSHGDLLHPALVQVELLSHVNVTEENNTTHSQCKWNKNGRWQWVKLAYTWSVNINADSDVSVKGSYRPILSVGLWHWSRVVFLPRVLRETERGLTRGLAVAGRSRGTPQEEWWRCRLLLCSPLADPPHLNQHRGGKESQHEAVGFNLTDAACI